MAKRGGLILREVVLFGMLGGLTFAAKVVMSGLPNIEPVSLFIMLFAVVFGRKCLYPMYIYVALELLCYPMDLWSFAYLYVWAILALLSWLLRKSQSPLTFAILAGGFGLCYGALCALVYLVVEGPASAIGWWIQGISFDIAHCAGNFVMALLLFQPLRKLLQRLWVKLHN